VFGCGYGDNLQQAHALLEDIVSKHAKVHAEPAPLIKVHELADSSVNFIVRPWADTGDYWDVFWDVTRAVKDRFDAEGLNIPFPQQEVHMHQITD
jgi:small conductance mechanosensitive channel